ncbi:MAG: 30S ribosomal protein S20 [bacterium]|nr:30S ribosomal protein S20 [bacterium]
MPIIKSAKKALRQSARRKVRNTQQTRKIKNLVKEVKKLVLLKKYDEAEKLLPQVYKYLDKAAKTKLMKRNTTDRNKSKITKLVLKSRQ